MQLTERRRSFKDRKAVYTSVVVLIVMPLLLAATLICPAFWMWVAHG